MRTAVALAFAALLTGCLVNNTDYRDQLDVLPTGDGGAVFADMTKPAAQLPDLTPAAPAPDLVRCDATPAPDLKPAPSPDLAPACHVGGTICGSASDCCNNLPCNTVNLVQTCCHARAGGACTTVADCCQQPNANMICAAGACCYLVDGVLNCGV